MKNLDSYTRVFTVYHIFGIFSYKRLAHFIFFKNFETTKIQNGEVKVLRLTEISCQKVLMFIFNNHLSTDDACSPNPCQNDGNCTRDTNKQGFKCNCSSKYTGDTCENKIGERNSVSFHCPDQVQFGSSRAAFSITSRWC